MHTHDNVYQTSGLTWLDIWMQVHIFEGLYAGNLLHSSNHNNICTEKILFTDKTTIYKFYNFYYMTYAGPI